MVNDCCFCLSLRTGSILVGVYFVVVGNFTIFKSRLGADEREDDGENNTWAKSLEYFSLTLNILLIALGFAIVVAACRTMVAALKVCSVLVLARLCAVVIFLVLANSPFERAGVLAYYLTLVLLLVILNLYFAVVLWSYARELEAGYPGLVVVATATIPRRQGGSSGQAAPEGGPEAAHIRFGRPSWAPGAGFLWSGRRPGPWTRPATTPGYPGPPAEQQRPGPPSAPPAYSRVPLLTLDATPRAPVQPPVQNPEGPERPK